MDVQILFSTGYPDRMDRYGVREPFEFEGTEPWLAIPTNQHRRQHPVYLVDQIRSQECCCEYASSLDEDTRQPFLRKQPECPLEIDMASIRRRDFEHPSHRLTKPLDAPRSLEANDPGACGSETRQQSGGLRNPESSIQENANRLAHDLSVPPHRQLGIVREHRPGPDHDRIVCVTQPVDEFARC